MSKQNEVDEYLTKKKHPLTKEIQRIREIIMQADSQMEECIKWSSPTFMYKGNMASFFMNAKKMVSLMFHKGALLDNPDGLLTGDGKEARVARFDNLADIESKKKALETLVKIWIKYRDEKT